jgi:hypothetical protein
MSLQQSAVSRQLSAISMQPLAFELLEQVPKAQAKVFELENVNSCGRLLVGTEC